MLLKLAKHTGIQHTEIALHVPDPHVYAYTRISSTMVYAVSKSVYD